MSEMLRVFLPRHLQGGEGVLFPLRSFVGDSSCCVKLETRWSGGHWAWRLPCSSPEPPSCSSRFSTCNLSASTPPSPAMMTPEGQYPVVPVFTCKPLAEPATSDTLHKCAPDQRTADRLGRNRGVPRAPGAWLAWDAGV